jgi:hypothetical protein
VRARGLHVTWMNSSGSIAQLREVELCRTISLGYAIVLAFNLETFKAADPLSYGTWSASTLFALKKCTRTDKQTHRRFYEAP